MRFNIPKKTFDPHPIGRHTGVVANIQDEGIQESSYDGQTKSQHKISIRIDSDSAFMEGGEPFSIIQWFSLSSSPKSNLRKFREAVLDRGLTREEETDFDPAELIGKRISYRVDHKEKQDGGTRAVIREGSVEPTEGKVGEAYASSTEPTPVSVADNGADGGSLTQTPTEDDLAF
jgi:hypothetical protein